MTDEKVKKIAETLKGMSQHYMILHYLSKRDGDDVQAKVYINEAMAYDSVLSMLSDPGYLDSMYKIFVKDAHPDNKEYLTSLAIEAHCDE